MQARPRMAASVTTRRLCILILRQQSRYRITACDRQPVGGCHDAGTPAHPGARRSRDDLRGCGAHNKGLRLRVLQDQARGNEGAVRGRFLILDAGDNVNSPSLGPLVERVTDAEAVLGVIRRERPGCVSVVNANSLVLDQE